MLAQHHEEVASCMCMNDEIGRRLLRVDQPKVMTLTDRCTRIGTRLRSVSEDIGNGLECRLVDVRVVVSMREIGSGVVAEIGIECECIAPMSAELRADERA